MWSGCYNLFYQGGTLIYVLVLVGLPIAVLVTFDIYYIHVVEKDWLNMFYFYLFNVLYFLHHRLSDLGGILFKNLHWGYICPGLDFLSYCFVMGQNFSEGRGEESNPGYCGYSLVTYPFGYNVNIFLVSLYLWVQGDSHHKKSSGEEVTLFVICFIDFRL